MIDYEDNEYGKNALDDMKNRSFMKYKAKFMLMALVTMAAVSCSGNKSENTVANGAHPQDVAVCVDVKGKWYLEDIVFSDSEYVRVRPDVRLSSLHQYIVFEDNTYFIQTNCNTISGTYAVKGDSIIFGDGMMTEKACDNMAVEDALRRILPNIVTIYIQNDSIARLDSSNPSEYIVLRKATEKR